MDAVSTIGVASIGAAAGVVLKWLADTLSDRLRDRRADLVWRRERLTDAAADLLRVSADLWKATSGVARAAIEFTSAEGEPDQWRRLTEAHEERRPLLLDADRTLEVFRLFAPPTLATEGEAYVDQCKRPTTAEDYVDFAASVLEKRRELVASIRTAIGSEA